MTKRKKKSRREIDVVKDEVLETARKVVEQTLPIVGEGINNILSRFTKTMEEKIRRGITGKLDGKKSKNKKGESPNVNPQ